MVSMNSYLLILALLKKVAKVQDENLGRVCHPPLSLLMALITSAAKIAQSLWSKPRGLKVSETLAGSLKDSFCEGTIIIEQDSAALIDLLVLNAADGGYHFIHPIKI